MWEYTMSMEAEARAMFDCIKADVQETGKKKPRLIGDLTPSSFPHE